MPAVLSLPLHSVFVLASFFSCDTPVPPEVLIDYKNNPPVINNTVTPAQMSVLRGGSASPEYGGEFPNVEGLTAGHVDISHDVVFQNKIHPVLGDACVRATTVHIRIVYTPVIYISNKSAPGSCRYTTTLEHEMKHVKVDLDALNELLRSIKPLVATSVAAAQDKKPVDVNTVSAQQKMIAAELSKTIKGATDSFQQTRTVRQVGVDSHAEYERLSRACPE